MLSGLLNTYEKKDFENFVTDFTPGFFRGKGVKTGEKGRFSSCDHKFSNDIGFQGVKIFRVCLCVSQSKIWSLCSIWVGFWVKHSLNKDLFFGRFSLKNGWIFQKLATKY